MPRKSKRKRWNFVELELLKKYIQSKSDELKLAFYQNIIEGQILYKKSPRFYIEMSEPIKRSPPQCKSKFQKMEHFVYTDMLSLDKDHYFLYKCIKQLNSELKIIEIRKKRMMKTPQYRMLRKTRKEENDFENKRQEDKNNLTIRQDEKKKQDILEMKLKLENYQKVILVKLENGEIDLKLDSQGMFFYGNYFSLLTSLTKQNQRPF